MADDLRAAIRALIERTQPSVPSREELLALRDWAREADAALSKRLKAITP